MELEILLKFLYTREMTCCIKEKRKKCEQMIEVKKKLNKAL